MRCAGCGCTLRELLEESAPLTVDDVQCCLGEKAMQTQTLEAVAAVAEARIEEARRDGDQFLADTWGRHLEFVSYLARLAGAADERKKNEDVARAITRQWTARNERVMREPLGPLFGAPQGELFGGSDDVA